MQGDVSNPDPERDRKWAEELRRRIHAVESGEMKLISLEEADAEAERLLADDEASSAEHPPSSPASG